MADGSTEEELAEPDVTKAVQLIAIAVDRRSQAAIEAGEDLRRLVADLSAAAASYRIEAKGQGEALQRATEHRDWAERVASMWSESPNTRAEITARFSGLAWALDHLVAALAGPVEADHA